jgi:hypothetical protein
LDQAAPLPPGLELPNQLVWEELDPRFTPADDYFVVSDYATPDLTADDWRLAIPAPSREP